MHNHHIHLLTTLVALFFTNSARAADFCVADLTLPQTAHGYQCKPRTNVTVDDFVHSGLVTGGTTKNINKGNVTRAFVQQFPGLNGLDLAAVRVDLEADGAVHLHSHPYSSEMILVVEGTVTAGFVSGLGTNNTVYVKKLKKWELMVIPQGLVHFQVNTGSRHATMYVSFAKADPGAQFISSAFFGNDLSSLFVSKATNIGRKEVKRVKALLGGSG
ncbi:Germin-like protein [Linum grandiflorum]